eukprot:s3386_g3.t1
MTVRSVQTVLSTGNEFNEDSDLKTSVMKATSTLPSKSTHGSYANFIACGTTATSIHASGGQTLWYTFCPNITGVADISTCGSTVDTWLQVRGPWTSVDVSCDDCGSCGLQAETSINVINGVCYEILIYGFTGGNYVLSTSCQDANPPDVGCGSSVSGSIVGIPNYFGADGGDAVYQFCPTNTGYAEVSTCGSAMDAQLYIKGAGVDMLCEHCHECADGSSNQNVTINFTSGECYHIFVGGPSWGEQSYNLYINCTNVAAPASSSQTTSVACGSSVTSRANNISVGDGYRFSFCPNSSGVAEISSCLSEDELDLAFHFPAAVWTCVACGTCPGAGPYAYHAQVALIHFVAGECYEILAGEGFYRDTAPASLSVSCSDMDGAGSSSAVDIQCGSQIVGEESPWSGSHAPRKTLNPGWKAHHRFCPKSSGVATISTCSSSFDTGLRISGPNLAIDCDDCGGCWALDGGLHESVSFNFTAGQCYEVVVDARTYSDSFFVYFLDTICDSGNVTASVMPPSLECDSHVAFEGAGTYSFCPSSTVAATISTCGSSSGHFLHVTGTDVDITYTDDSSDSSQCGAQVTLDVSSGECLEITVDDLWSVWSYGLVKEYDVSIGCAAVAARSVTCPIYSFSKELLPEVVQIADPVTAFATEYWGGPFAKLQQVLKEVQTYSQILLFSPSLALYHDFTSFATDLFD